MTQSSEREDIRNALFEIENKHSVIGSITAMPIFDDIYALILQCEQEIRAEFEKDKEALLSDIRRLTKEKYDERRKVAEEIKDLIVHLKDVWIKPGTRYYTEIVLCEDLLDYIDKIIAKDQEQKKVDG